MIKSPELVTKAAIDAGVDRQAASTVIDAFVTQIRAGLVHDGEVQIDGLGTITMRAYDIKQKMRVLRGPKAGSMVTVTTHHRAYFKKSHILRRQLKEEHGDMMADEEMEKYGVDEGSAQEDLEKKAAQGCPECGKTPTRHGNTLICPTHGSEPFEGG